MTIVRFALQKSQKQIKMHDYHEDDAEPGSGRFVKLPEQHCDSPLPPDKYRAAHVGYSELFDGNGDAKLGELDVFQHPATEGVLLFDRISRATKNRAPPMKPDAGENIFVRFDLIFFLGNKPGFIELDYGKNYRKARSIWW